MTFVGPLPSDKAVLSLSSDGTRFFILPKAEITPDNPSGIPSWEAQYGSWRSHLSDPSIELRYTHSVTGCTVNDMNAAVLQQAWGSNLSFEDVLAEATFRRSLAVSSALERTALIHAAWQETSQVPDGPVEIRESKPLSPYQRVPVVASQLLPGYGLFMDPGTGKTAIVISRVCTSAKALRESGSTRPYCVLVVAPKALRTNWKNEFAEFATVPGRVTVLRGGSQKRIRGLAETISIRGDEMFAVVIVSYGLLVQTWDNLLSRVPWDLAVADEAHAFKDPRTKRAQQCFALRDASKSRMALTGTPIINSVLDLYALLEFLDPGLSGFPSFKAFQKAHENDPKPSDSNAGVMDYVKRLPALRKRLSQVSYIVRKEQVLKDLPAKVFDLVEVEMGKRQQEAYDQMASDLYFEIEQDLENADASSISMVVNGALVKLMKLAQITSGFLIVNEQRDEFGDVISPKNLIIFDDNPKLELLVDEFKSHKADEKVIIWSCWNAEIDMISRRFKEHSIDHVTYRGKTKDADRDAAVYRFNNDPSMRLFIGNAEAGGAGLNLLGYQPGVNDDLGIDCTRMLYSSQNWKAVFRWQSEDRANRRGSRRQLRVSDVVCPDTIDEDIRARAVAKKTNALMVQDLREILSGLLRGQK